MKYFFRPFGVFLMAMALLSAPARAYETKGPVGKPEKEIAQFYERIARSFNDNLRIAGIIRQKQMMMVEYLPQGEHFKDWTQMVTVSFFRSSADRKEHKQQVAQTIARWRDGLEGKIKMPVPQRKISFDIVNRPPHPPETEPEQAAIANYTIGAGDKQENNAAIIYSSPNPLSVAVFQFQKRDKQTISAEDMKKMHGVLNWALMVLNRDPASWQGKRENKPGSESKKESQ